MLEKATRKLGEDFFKAIEEWILYERVIFERVYDETEKASQTIILAQDKIYQLEEKKKDLV